MSKPRLPTRQARGASAIANGHSPSCATHRRGLAVAGAVWMVYGRAIRSPFIFDDQASVLNNPSIVKLWPLWGDPQHPGPLNPPKDLATSGRPLVNLSLALNYHFGGFDPLGYHLFNLAVHVLSALLLMAIVSRTLHLEYFGAQFHRVSGLLALAVALIVGFAPATDRDRRLRHAAHRTARGTVLSRHVIWQPALLGRRYAGHPHHLAGLLDSGMFGRHGLQGSDGFGSPDRAAVRADVHCRIVPPGDRKVMAAVRRFLVELGPADLVELSTLRVPSPPAFIWVCPPTPGGSLKPRCSGCISNLRFGLGR